MFLGTFNSWLTVLLTCCYQSITEQIVTLRGVNDCISLHFYFFLNLQRLTCAERLNTNYIFIFDPLCLTKNYNGSECSLWLLIVWAHEALKCWIQEPHSVLLICQLNQKTLILIWQFKRLPGIVSVTAHAQRKIQTLLFCSLVLIAMWRT